MGGGEECFVLCTDAFLPEATKNPSQLVMVYRPAPHALLLPDSGPSLFFISAPFSPFPQLCPSYVFLSINEHPPRLPFS